MSYLKIRKKEPPLKKSGTVSNSGLEMDPDATAHRPTLEFDGDAGFALTLLVGAAKGAS